MTHYRLRENDPSAIILAQNPQSGSYEEAKIYTGSQCKEIYLNDKQNFGIKFFNPLQEKIGARISFNGQKSEHLLIINPGQDITLERFLGESRKMLFETYVVDGGNQKAVDAIVNNGSVKIEFFKEKVKYYFNNTITYTNTVGLPHYGNNTTGNINLLSSNVTNTSNVKYRGTKRTLYSSKQMDMDQSFVSQDSLEFSDYVCESKELETGRIEKGEVSNQNLKQTEDEFENYSFMSIEYKLLPISQINRESKEVRQYCHQCRYRLRKENWVYCPKCGTRL